ncbi:MAG: glycosyltransferase family 4 protein [Lachnospiraceae bacterium]|jgi:glycosyltransferase involved in cell wall biosynthesis|nr:glycosyltransferase family 4 protein [Lachnospiraceae bacterium]
MKKILYIAISSQTGGVPRHILQVLKHAKKFGYSIAVAVPDDGDYFPWFQEYASEMVNLKLKPYSVSSLWKLHQYIRRNKIDLIHSHGKGAGMYSRPLRLLNPGIKVVHTFHGIYLEQYGSLLRTIYCAIERVLRFLTCHFICVSSSELKEARRLRFVKKGHTSVICNGVDPELFSQVSIDREQYLEEFGFPKDAYIIGCVARLEQMKGHSCLLTAFAGLVKKYPFCRLLLVGDGPDRERIEARIQKLGLNQMVCLAGFRHDVPQLLKLFNLFVSASLKEGMPYTLIEAQAAKTPVVATDVIGNRDVIHDGENGFLVPSQDAKELARGMAAAIKDPVLCRSYGINGQENVRKFFSEKVLLKKLFGVYSATIKGERIC